MSREDMPAKFYCVVVDKNIHAYNLFDKYF